MLLRRSLTSSAAVHAGSLLFLQVLQIDSDAQNTGDQRTFRLEPHPVASQTRGLKLLHTMPVTQAVAVATRCPNRQALFLKTACALSSSGTSPTPLSTSLPNNFIHVTMTEKKRSASPRERVTRHAMKGVEQMPGLMGCTQHFKRISVIRISRCKAATFGSCESDWLTCEA